MKKKFDLTGKKAIVTGGGSGIGRAISIALAESGTHVTILDLSHESAEKVADEIIAFGGEAVGIQCDVSNEDSVKNVMAGSSLDILVNNAGIAHIGNVADTSSEDFEKVFNVNVKGVFNCLKEGVNLMKSKGGVIINVSSVAAHVGVSDRFAYSMSKGAVHTMTLSVAKDFVSHGIRCNCISPGRVHTPFVDGFLAKNYPGKEEEMFETLSKTQPIGRMGKPEEMGSLVLYLCSDEASFITGSDFSIDGGFITLNN